MSANEAGSKSDIWIAVGVVFFLGLGASATYLLSSPEPKRPVATAPVKGERIDAAAPVAASPDKKSDGAGTPAKVIQAAPNGGTDFATVTFDTLGSYYYEIPNLEAQAKADPKTTPKPPKEQIPAPIKSLTGKKIAVQGFMVPIKIEKGATKSFLLVKDQSLCCYGRMPRMNEWISVKMSEGKAAKFIGDQPVTVFGKIDVGEEIDKGEVLSIYRMEAEDVAGPLDL
jgi:hypothetical protein